MPQVQRLVITSTQIQNQQISLTPSQRHYLVRVLRLRAGDRFIAIHAETGDWWLAEQQGIDDLARLIEPIEIQTELAIAVTLLIAMPKTGMDDIVRQTTELGVAELVPVISDRTILKPSPNKLERWQRIAEEATEQSERQLVPTLHAPISFPQSLQTWSGAIAPSYLCSARGQSPHLLTQLQKQQRQAQKFSRLFIAIGPEGGWTEPELELAIASGYESVSLGQRILRAVTAPAAVMSLISAVVEADTTKTLQG